mgnify:CR=1 FL=1
MIQHPVARITNAQASAVASGQPKRKQARLLVGNRSASKEKGQTRSLQPLRRPGDYSGVAAPDPIPNSAVKRPSADGTSSQDAEE